MDAAQDWTLTRDAKGIAWLALDCVGRSANTLTRAVLLELQSLLQGLQHRPPRVLVISSGKASGFIAGADIREFTSFTSPEQALAQVELGQHVLESIESLPCPSVALLHGFVMGGGLELALACRYRIGLDDGRLALSFPEVQLGIHPGFGGTVRSVRLLGVRAAMDLMLTGRTIRAARARAMGLIDRTVPDEASLAATALALIGNAPPPRRPALLERALSWPLIRRAVAPSLRRQVAARVLAEHYPAPYAIIELWARHGASGRAAFEAEAQSIVQLISHPTARNLVRIFLLQERLKGQVRESAPIEHVHVIGAGVMGGDIAAWCALRGLTVTLEDRELKFIEPALTRARELFDKRIGEPAERERALARLTADVEGSGVPKADVLIEAIFEDLETKRALFARVATRLKPGATLATNTSSIRIETLAETLPDPAALVGLHFFNPVAQMPLIEVIHAPRTGPAHLTRAMGLARRLDKLPLPCASGPGFLVNRVLFPYLYEALYAAGEGIRLAAIDRAAVDFGMPMGPIELADVVGLDVVLHVGQIITEALGRPEPPYLATMRELLAAGKRGRKSGEGFYRWVGGKCQRPVPGTTPPPPDLVDRLILPIVNECVACLREGIVADADLADAGVVFGTGFAPFRGGPIQYARERGFAEVQARLAALASSHGSRFAPDPGWAQVVAEPKA